MNRFNFISTQFLRCGLYYFNLMYIIQSVVIFKHCNLSIHSILYPAALDYIYIRNRIRIYKEKKIKRFFLFH